MSSDDESPHRQGRTSTSSRESSPPPSPQATSQKSEGLARVRYVSQPVIRAQETHIHPQGIHPQEVHATQLAIEEPAETPRKYYNRDGVRVGWVFSPKQIREILKRSGFFEERDIKCWRRYLVVPSGRSQSQWIYFQVAITGISMRAYFVDGVFVDAGNLDLRDIWKRNMTNGFEAKQLMSLSRYTP
jgi:hypothetical protein